MTSKQPKSRKWFPLKHRNRSTSRKAVPVHRDSQAQEPKNCSGTKKEKYSAVFAPGSEIILMWTRCGRAYFSHCSYSEAMEVCYWSTLSFGLHFPFPMTSK